MRKWIVALVVLLVLVAGGLAVVVVNLNGWLARDRDWIAGEASHAVGRTVTFDEIGASLGGALSVRLANVRVADDPSYAKEPFLAAKSVRVAVRILPALRRRIEVRSVTIEAPVLTVIRDARGLNVATLGGVEGGKAGAANGAPGPAAAAAVLVSAIRIDDGTVRFVDRTARPPAEYRVDRLDVRASDVSPSTPVSLRAAAAVLGADHQNVSVDGIAGPLSGRETPVDLTVRLDGVSAAGLAGTFTLKARAALPASGAPAVLGKATLRGVSAVLPGGPRLTGLDSTIDLKGESAVVEPTRLELNGVPLKAEATVERFQPARARFAVKAAALDVGRLGFGGDGVRAPEVLRDVVTTGTAELMPGGPTAHVSVRSPRGSLRDVAYENLETDAGLAAGVATLDRMRVAALGGSYEGSGRYDTAAARFESRSTVRGMAMPELLAHAFPAAAKQVDGRLDATLALAGTGRDWNAIRPTLTGQGRMDVRDGALKGVNLADGVLGGVTGVAGLTALVPPDVRARYPDVFGTGDTRFDQLGGSVRIADQRLTTDDLRMVARDYAVDGRGTVGFDGRVDFTATLVASERLTADIGARVREARYVENAQQRVAIPFRFVGTMPGVKPVPDAEWLARTLARGALGTGIEKLLGGKRKPGEKEKPEQDLLRKGLEGLLGR